MITYHVYSKQLEKVEIADGFFQGWIDPPSKKKHREILEKSYRALVAVDESKGEIVGFINAISDGVLSCYIPLLEVLPKYQHQKIGSELVIRMLADLSDFYMIDLCCDKELQAFYEKVGMKPTLGMIKRNHVHPSRSK